MSDRDLMFCLNVCASLLLGAGVLRWRWLLVKPSIIFIAYYQVSVMWPGIWWLDHIEDLVPRTREYIWALHGTGLAATALAVLSWRRTARGIVRRLRRSPPPDESTYRLLAIAILGAFVAVVTAWYLATLGWRNTGLSAILSGAEGNVEVRESAMKLLGSRLLQYAWALMAYAAAYLLAYWLAFAAVIHARSRRFGAAALASCGFAGLLAIVALPGARGPMAMLVLATLMAFYVRNGFRLSPIRISVILAAALALPALLTLWRNAELLDWGTFAVYYLDIVDRVAGRSVQDNIWMVGYVQQQGLFGPSGIPLFARLSGTPPLDVFNIVGLHFRPDGLQSISANSSSIAVNYGCFGLAGGFGLTLFVTFAMDALLILQSRLPRALLAPCIGICGVISINFAMTTFSTVFLTHGLLPTIVLCYLLHFAKTTLVTRRRSGQDPSTAEFVRPATNVE
jgi:hypothetical protein